MQEPDGEHLGTITINFTESDVREMLEAINKEEYGQVFRWGATLNNMYGDSVGVKITVGEDE